MSKVELRRMIKIDRKILSILVMIQDKI